MSGATPVKAWFERITAEACRACEDHYGARLVSLAIFGSVARGTMRPDSDVDMLIIADDLPRGRLARVDEFRAVEVGIEPLLRAAAQEGVYTTLSPVLKTPAEVEQGSPLFLDMTDQARIVFDRDDFFKTYLERLRARLRTQGARRVRLGGGYYWVLKPDLKPGEEIPL